MLLITFIIFILLTHPFFVLTFLPSSTPSPFSFLFSPFVPPRIPLPYLLPIYRTCPSHSLTHSLNHSLSYSHTHSLTHAHSHTNTHSITFSRISSIKLSTPFSTPPYLIALTSYYPFYALSHLHFFPLLFHSSFPFSSFLLFFRKVLEESYTDTSSIRNLGSEVCRAATADCNRCCSMLVTDLLKVCAYICTCNTLQANIFFKC